MEATSTQFGQMVRRERKEKNMLLGPAAASLGISIPYLSQIETGARSAPAGFVEKVIRLFELPSSEASKFRRAAAQAMTDYSIQLRPSASASDRDLAAQLATSFARLSPEKKRQLRALVEGE